MRTRLIGLMLVLAVALIGCTNEDNEQAMTDGQASEEGANIEMADQAGDMEEEIEPPEAKHEQYAVVNDDIEHVYAGKTLNESIELINHTLENNMSPAAFADQQDDFETLGNDVKEDKEAAEVTAEEEARKEQEAEDQAQEEAAADKKESGVDALVGYWLNTEENIAAHITESYITSAMPYSDFITNDDISNVDPVSETTFNITYSDGEQGEFKLTDNKETLITPGLKFKRVSKEEANAIFDGHYELP